MWSSAITVRGPFTMASGGLSKAVKATMGRALRETGAALKEASGEEVSLIFCRFILHDTARGFLQSSSCFMFYFLKPSLTRIMHLDFLETQTNHNVVRSKAVYDKRHVYCSDCQRDW
jgi:hypothetical protein